MYYHCAYTPTQSSSRLGKDKNAPAVAWSLPQAKSGRPHGNGTPPRRLAAITNDQESLQTWKTSKPVTKQRTTYKAQAHNKKGNQ